jgi:NIMA (never in mitosis gene a)-related kinase
MYDSFVADNKINIVMELCENGDLGMYIKRQMGRPLGERVIWKYFIEMCLGLLYLHSNKILHRDIKTINMFLTKDDCIKIGDLGVAKMLN